MVTHFKVFLQCKALLLHVGSVPPYHIKQRSPEARGSCWAFIPNTKGPEQRSKWQILASLLLQLTSGGTDDEQSTTFESKMPP